MILSYQLDYYALPISLMMPLQTQHDKTLVLASEHVQPAPAIELVACLTAGLD